MVQNVKAFTRRVSQKALRKFDTNTRQAVHDGVQFAKNVAITKSNTGHGKVKGTLRTAQAIKLKRNIGTTKGQIILYYDNTFANYVKGAADALANKIIPTRKSAMPGSQYYDRNFASWVEANRNDLNSKVIFGRTLYDIAKSSYGITVAKNMGSSVAMGTQPILPLKSGQQKIRENIKKIYK